MSSVLLLLRKDLLVLRRSPLLLGMLVAYPVLIAVLVGLVAIYANSKPRVALVDEAGLPPKIVLAGHTFDVDKTIARVSKDVKLVRLSHRAAEDELANGKVVAVVTVPPNFLTELRGMLHSPKLMLQITHGGISARVGEQVQALVYALNHQLQRAFITTNLGYVNALKHGATIKFLGRTISILGLDRAAGELRQLPPSRQRDRILAFIDDARLALRETNAAMRATASPIQLVQAPSHGRTWALSAQVQAYALGLTITFLALLLAAAALAAERDENVVSRLVRGLVRLGQLVWSKVALTAAVSLALGIGIAVAFGIAVDVAGVQGGEPWPRVPLLLVGILLAGASFGALGALVGGLAREARTATLAALLLALPIVFLGLVPREIVPLAGWVSDAFPFAHLVRFASSALYDPSPWETVWRESVWLVGLAVVFGLLARGTARRLLA
jgi:ABC-type multidrug transport system permease subunit